jgi:hypothetical protein
MVERLRESRALPPLPTHRSRPCIGDSFMIMNEQDSVAMSSKPRHLPLCRARGTRGGTYSDSWRSWIRGQLSATLRPAR